MKDKKVHTIGDDYIKPKSWNEFRKTGLFFMVNQFLHIFGWVLVFDIDKDEIKTVFPARTKFRGFDNSVTDEQYVKISQYMKDNGEELLKEAKGC